MTEKRLMGSTEACRELGIARSTLTQWLDKGWIIPAQQLEGGVYVFTTGEVKRARAAYDLRAAQHEADADEAAIA